MTNFIDKEPIMDDEECWGYKKHLKEEEKRLKRRKKFEKMAERIIENPRIDEIIKILEETYQQALESNESFLNDVDDYTSQWGGADPDCPIVQG